MPDLTIEIMAMCSSLERQTIYHIGEYTQTLYHGTQMDDECTCPAYKFAKKDNKTCKHLKQAYEQECGWHQQYSEETQTEEGKCPRCGGSTVYVRVAV